MTDKKQTVRADKELEVMDGMQAVDAGRPSLLASAMLGIIAFYQRFLSPAHPACCRFAPTCSAYAAQAIRRHGALKGSGLAFWRLLRCQPFSKGGYDPVPEKKISARKSNLSNEMGKQSMRPIRKEMI